MKKSVIPFLVLIAITVLALFSPALPTTIITEGLDSGDTAWILMATAMVLLMTPGLAYFYGGMIDNKNIISTMLQSYIAMGVISVIWIVVGFSLAFGEDIGGFIGNPMTHFMFKGVMDAPLTATIPTALFAFFQLKFAIITPALISGTFSERIKFQSYILFICLFCIFIYTPLAHMTWHANGIMFGLGVLDFAGGTVVHMSAGLAALAAAIYLKGDKSSDSGHIHSPANIPFVLLGTGLLWFGWFGFNGGSALAANALAVSAFAATNTASAAAGLAWVLLDVVKGRKPSALGFCIGAVVGLVAITPACGFVTIPHSLVIGVVGAIISNFVVEWKSKTGLADTLDVFACHGVGGMVGMVLTGVFANSAVNPAAGNGLFFGETKLFFLHMGALVGVAAFAFVGSLILLKVTDLISPLKVTEEEFRLGQDLSQHGENM